MNLKLLSSTLKDVPSRKQVIKAIRDDVSELKSDMRIVKAAVTDLSQRVTGYERCITHLQAA
jgi:alpha/beta superfamily hydrolase